MPPSFLAQIARYAPGSLVPALNSVAWAFLFTRIFPAAAYGRYALVVSGALLAASLLHQWLTQGVTRFLPGAGTAPRRRRLREAVAVSLLTVAAVALLAGGGVALLLAALLPPSWRSLLVAAWVLAVLTAVWMPLLAVLQAGFRAGRHALYQMAYAVLRLGAALALALVTDSPAALLWGGVVALLLILPGQWRDAGLPAPSLGLWRRRWRSPTVGRLAGYGFPMVGWMVAAALLETGDRYVIQFFRGPGEVGIYTANYQLVANGVMIASAPVLLAAHPMLMQAWSGGDRVGAGDWLGRIVGAIVLAGVVLVAAVAILAPELALLLGAGFREGHPVLPWVLAGGVLWQLGMYAHKPLEFAGRTGTLFRLAMAAAALNVVLNVAFVPRWGYVAAAWTTVASFAFYVGVTTVRGRAVLPWGVQGRPLLAAAGVCALAVAAAHPLRAAAAGWPVLGRVGALGLLTGTMVLLSLWLGRGVLRRLQQASRSQPQTGRP